MSVCEVKCQYLRNFLSYAPHKKKRKIEITPIILMPELCTLRMMLPLIIICPWMKLHNNSRIGVIFQTRKSDKGE